MSFSQNQIAVMLEEYEADRQTGMDVPAVAEEIYQYNDCGGSRIEQKAGLLVI